MALKYEGVRPGTSFSAPYPELGLLFWSALKYEVYDLLCESKEQVPREWLNDLITGDIRNLIVGISAAITSKYEISVGIGLPAAALIFKSGIFAYCGKRPKRKPFRTVRQLIASKDKSVREWEEDKKRKKKQQKKKAKRKQRRNLLNARTNF